MGRDIQDASEHGDWAVVRGIVHKIKGTAGNVGATALQRQAVELESKLLNQPNASIQALEEKIGQTLEQCERFLADLTDASGKKVPVTRDEVNKALDELALLLQNRRIIPIELLDKVKAAQDWGANSESLDELVRAAQMFEHKDALLALELIRKELEAWYEDLSTK